MAQLAEEEVYPAQVMSVTLLGGASTAAMLVDAYTSASQAESIGAPAAVSAHALWTPVFGVTRNALGAKDCVVGLAASF